MATKLESARTQLVMRHPFFASIVLRHPIIETDTVPTAAVDRAGRIRINPTFLESLSIQEIIFLLAHEAMHVVFAHLARRGDRDHHLWNVTNDAIINDMLIKGGIGKFIENGIRIEDAYDYSSEALYEKLKKEQEGGGQGNGQGSNREDSGQSGGFDLQIDDLMHDDGGVVTEDERQRAINEGKVEMAQAAQGARMQGKLDGALGAMIDGYLESKLPWYELLEKYMCGKAEMHHNWSRPNKRRFNYAYLPRRERMPGMGTIVIGIDVSGSIGDEEIKEFLGHLNRIRELCNPERVHVLYCTTEIEHIDTYERGDDIEQQKQRWWGGTNMCAITDWVESCDEDIDACVIFTDGYTPYPRSQGNVETMWVITTDYEPPAGVGEVLHTNDK